MTPFFNSFMSLSLILERFPSRRESYQKTRDVIDAAETMKLFIAATPDDLQLFARRNECDIKDPALRSACARHAGKLGTLAELIGLSESDRVEWTSLVQSHSSSRKEQLAVAIEERLKHAHDHVQQYKEVEGSESDASTYSDYSDSSSDSSD